MKKTKEKLNKIEIRSLFSPSKLSKKESKFKMIDLFAGIGGIRLGFESIGGENVFTSEWDESAKKHIKQILMKYRMVILQRLSQKRYLLLIFY